MKKMILSVAAVIACWSDVGMAAQFWCEYGVIGSERLMRGHNGLARRNRQPLFEAVLTGRPYNSYASGRPIVSFFTSVASEYVSTAGLASVSLSANYFSYEQQGDTYKTFDYGPVLPEQAVIECRKQP